jgi:hypothetical protein
MWKRAYEPTTPTRFVSSVSPRLRSYRLRRLVLSSLSCAKPCSSNVAQAGAVDVSTRRGTLRGKLATFIFSKIGDRTIERRAMIKGKKTRRRYAAGLFVQAVKHAVFIIEKVAEISELDAQVRPRHGSMCEVDGNIYLG